MKLTHSFTVPVDVEQAWEVLLDIERIAPCMPGAALESVDGDDFTGSVKVRLGPIGLTYKGKASFVSKDAASHRAVIDAQGKDARGNGTAKATITATLTGEGSSTAVNVVTDLNITGKPAQFGRGVMVDVGNKLIQQFADCLAGKLSEPDAGSGAADGGQAGVAGAGGGAAASVAGSGAGAGVAGAEVGGAGSAEVASADAAGAGVAGAAGADVAGIGGAGGDVAAASVGAADDDSDTDGAGGAVAAASGGAADDDSGTGGAAGDAAGGGQPVLGGLDAVDPAAVRRFTSADLEGAEQLGTADPVESAPGLAGTAARPAVEPAAMAERAPAQQPRPSGYRSVDEVEPIDLLGSAGPALAKRLAPVAAGVLLVVLLLLRRRRN